ncbi:hypothetical protein OG369_39780 [Streptomyces sp. NBC_01221]|uniref:hypothetical protein n=1 Tax=Streptomyces sp. NBC_01221 TaxID=2903782 RepID=UPI00225547FF|nr:hypothetical protein [Streptomyces sp. NBC_01221]MCX4791991.1 hypothetical protein [Streptomyces sp. NBC_01221]
MKQSNVTGHRGDIHDGLFNSHTGFLIDLACDAGRYEVVHPYERLDPARITEAPLSCPSCKAANSTDPTAPPHRGRLALEHAKAVLACADQRGYPPPLDDEGLRLAFLALGLEDPPAERLYPLIREHLTDMLTDRALTVPEGIPSVLVHYTRYTGGTLQAPIGVGDRLMHDGIASGNWHVVKVDAVEDTADGVVVTVSEKDWPHPRKWTGPDITRWFLKLDRAPSNA